MAPSKKGGSRRPSPARKGQLLTAAKRQGRRFAAHLRETFWEHKTHWLIVFAIIGVLGYLGHFLQQHDGLLGARYRMFRVLQNPWPRPLVYRDTVTVLIDDEAFWNDAEGRRPLKRDYLADLLRKVSAANPAVIGLDVRLPSPNPSGAVKTPASDKRVLLEIKTYAAETEKLLQTVDELTTKCDIVLVETLKRAGKTEVPQQSRGTGTQHGAAQAHTGRPRYERVADVYDEYGIKNPRISFAYEFLYPDRRRIPPRLLLVDGLEVDSFALAAARFYRPDLVQSKDWTQARFGSFIARSPETEISAHALMSASETEFAKIADKLKHKIVFIGGDWHESPSRSGRKVDPHLTPVGEIPGVVLHANYVEAILDDRTFDIPAREKLLMAVDIALGLLLAYVLFVQFRPPWLKVPVAAAVIGLPALACLLLMQYFAIYWDVVIMDALLIGHVAIERMAGGDAGTV